MKYDKWTLNQAMEDKKIINWQQQAADEYNLRLQAQARVENLTQELANVTEKLQKSETYSQYLLSKMHEVETQKYQIETQNRHFIELLKKAKKVILKRKEELSDFKQKNVNLKMMLEQNDFDLKHEQEKHQKTKQKLSSALSKLNEVNAELKQRIVTQQQTEKQLDSQIPQQVHAQTVITTKPKIRVLGSTDANKGLSTIVIPADIPGPYPPAQVTLRLGEYFAHKAIASQKEQASLSNNSSFLKQLMFLQWFNKQ